VDQSRRGRNYSSATVVMWKVSAKHGGELFGGEGEKCRDNAGDPRAAPVIANRGGGEQTEWGENKHNRAAGRSTRDWDSGGGGAAIRPKTKERSGGRKEGGRRIRWV